MQNRGSQGLTTQQIYQQYKIYPEDARSIAQALNLGKEPFQASAVQQITGFAQQAKEGGLTMKQAIAQYRQLQSGTTNEIKNPPDRSEPIDLPVHLRSLLVQSADRAQEELETLDRTIYEQVELPAAQAAVQRVLASDRNIEHLMVKLLQEEIKSRPGRLGGLVLQAVGHFRVPTLQGSETRYLLSSSDR
jgi:(2Fe-2S) ferredoxin